jgi:hypothetical protein
MSLRRFCGAETDIAGAGQQVYAAHVDIRAPGLDATERAMHAPCSVAKLSGWRSLPARLFVTYRSASVAVLGKHGGTV